jgi:hypothetical protein
LEARFAEKCREVCDAHHWELIPTGVLVRFGDGRRQVVSLEFFEFEQQELVRLSSAIGPVADLSRDELATALRSNAEIAHGALAIMDEELALVDTLLIEGLEVSALAATIEFLATSADEMERVVFQADSH